jgi:hypothetical protein
LPDDDKTWCCTALAWLHKSLSQFSDSEFWYLRSLATKEEQLGANHPDTATSVRSVAGGVGGFLFFYEGFPIVVG